MPKRHVLQLECGTGFEARRRANGDHVKHTERQTKELIKEAQTPCSHSVRYLRYPQPIGVPLWLVVVESPPFSFGSGYWQGNVALNQPWAFKGVLDGPWFGFSQQTGSAVPSRFVFRVLYGGQKQTEIAL